MAGTGEGFGLPKKVDQETRRREALVIIDKILNGTPDGTVDPKLGEDLRQKLLKFPSEPDRALLEHFRTQFYSDGIKFDAVFPEDLEK